MADATVYRAAARAAEDRLNEALRPHGVNIIRIPAPRPEFEANDEKRVPQVPRVPLLMELDGMMEMLRGDGGP